MGGSVDAVLILMGLAIAIWAISGLFSPPKKHKDFTLHDQNEATIRALGGSGTPDISKLKPDENKEERGRP